MFTVQFHLKSALSKPKSCDKGLSDNLQGRWFGFFICTGDPYYKYLRFT